MAKGLFYIALVCSWHGLACLVRQPADIAMEQYKNEYEWYLEKVNGYCTEESSLYLEQEAERIAKAKERQNSLLEKLL